MARGTPELKAKATMDSSGFQAGIAKANKSLESIEKTSASMAKQMKLIGAAIWAAVGVIVVKAVKKIVDFGKELVVLGQKSLSLKQSFKALAEAAGASSEKLLADMKKATKGTIAEIDLLSAANRMMLLGLDTSMFDEVMEIARRTAKATGQDINYMVDSLAMGLGRQSKMILDNLGIVFDVASAYEWYAETIGKTSAQLTESEKKLAFQTYAMKIASDNVNKLGADTLTLTEIGGIFTAKWADLRAFIGEKLVGAIGAVIEKFGGWEKIMGTVSGFIENTVKPKIVTLIDKVVEFGVKLASADYSEFITALKDLGGSLGDLVTSFNVFGSAIDESKTDWQGFIDFLINVNKVITKTIQFFTLLWILLSGVAKGLGLITHAIALTIPDFIAGFKMGKGALDSFKSGIDEVNRGFGESQKVIDEEMKAIDEKLIGAIERFIGIEILPKKIVINHNFPKVESDFDALQRELKDIKRTVTYSVKTVGTVPRMGGEQQYQFGGIVPKTQAILAHGGEAVLTTEMQRNLIALLRKPQINYNYTISGDVMLKRMLSEDMINEITRKVSLKQGKEVM